MAYPSEPQFGKFILLTEEGAQQGDPLGPLYFCLVVKELLDLLQSELVIGYLDDFTLGDEADICLQDFQMLEVSAARLGLQINRNKHRRRNRGGRGGPGPLTFLFEGAQYYRAPPLLKNAAPSLS